MLTVNLPNDAKEISESAFSDCSKLFYISVPESLEKIGKDAFGACTALQTVEYAADSDSFNRIVIYSGNELFTSAYGSKKN